MDASVASKAFSKIGGPLKKSREGYAKKSWIDVVVLLEALK
jgi:hypothetical protein